MSSRAVSAWVKTTGMVVQHNMNALNSYNKLNANVAGMKKSSEKLSSGYRINRAGDDAAGLAISEKMRSQIKGLNQAIRNSQDGINMIQTFEGAAQETHSILQRMKELASQSANGTYDDPTDRAAIQLEFDQLNDELNQIADTDFNGTVVLNGGQMADGLKAVDGKFNYATAERDPKQLTANDVNKVDYQKFDDKTNTTGLSTKADDIWKEISDNTWNRAVLTGEQGPDSVDVTLKFKSEDGTWSIENATNGANKAKFKAVKTDNGGFALKTATDVDIANVVLDATSLKNGDTITLTLNNPASGIAAPTNAGAIVTDTSKYTEDGGAASTKAKDVNLGVAIGTGLTNDKMSESVKKVLDALDGAQVDVTYVATKANTAADTKAVITFADGTKTAAIDATGVDGSTTLTLKDGTEYAIKSDAGVLTVYAGPDATNGTEVMKLTLGTHAAADKSAGTISYKVGLDYANYDNSKLPTVEISSTVDGKVSESNSFENSKAIMTYADNITLQTGARTKDSVNFTFNYNTDKTADMGELKANLNLSARADGLNTENLSLATQADANKAIDQIDKAINKTSMVRASFGAIQNRLEHKITNLTTTSENLTEAESSIRDTDMASEMMNYTKFNILQQAAQSMLAQANQQPQSILQLLG